MFLRKQVLEDYHFIAAGLFALSIRISVEMYGRTWI